MQGNPGYITSKELITFFNNVGLKITSEDAFAIMTDHNSEQTDYLNTEDFFSKLTCWKDKKSMAVAPVIQTKEKQIDREMESDIKKLK